jgi:hypothetical protein
VHAARRDPARDQEPLGRGEVAGAVGRGRLGGVGAEGRLLGRVPTARAALRLPLEGEPLAREHHSAVGQAGRLPGAPRLAEPVDARRAEREEEPAHGRLLVFIQVYPGGSRRSAAADRAGGQVGPVPIQPAGGAPRAASPAGWRAGTFAGDEWGPNLRNSTGDPLSLNLVA